MVQDNLGCTYSYVNADEVSNSMALTMARDALDPIIDKATRTVEKIIGVNPHGGGEATWNLLVRNGWRSSPRMSATVVRDRPFVDQ